MSNDALKIAVIHDWLVTYAGAERVLEQILKIYPAADLYSIVDFLPDNKRDFILNKEVTTSFIQRLPFAKTKYRNYLPFMPFAIEQFDLSKYDLVISSSHAVAKGVITGPDQIHICYIHSPIRYAWDLQHQYLRESGLDHGLKGFITKYLLHRIRKWDVASSNRVDKFIANSDFIRRRVMKVYRRDADVIFPPVATNDFNLVKEKNDYYLTASRLVPYKKIDLIIEAFSKMPDKQLIVIGDGPDFNKIKQKSHGIENVKLMGYQSFSVLKEKMSSAKAFVFAAEEDFGILPVEAQACGTPVIAFGKGGVLETVINNKTGVFYYTQSADSLVTAVNQFENAAGLWSAEQISMHAKHFSNEVFSEKLELYINKEVRRLNTVK